MAGAMFGHGHGHGPGQGSMSLAMGPLSTSPDHSSPESFEVDDDSNPAQTAHWQMHGQSSPNSTSQPPRNPAPLQKRRRVTRACDECRRKKIKCDGKIPCTHCTVYSYGTDFVCQCSNEEEQEPEQPKSKIPKLKPISNSQHSQESDCTYDQPSNRRRNPAPQYIEALESRVQRAETLLRAVFPGVDLNDPNIDTLIHQQLGKIKTEALENSSTDKSGDPNVQDAHLRSMIESTGQLDLDEAGYWDFHGGSSGTVFIKRMREQFGGLLGNDHSAPLFPRIPRPPLVASMFDSPRSSTDSPYDAGLPNTVDLPSRETAKVLCNDSLERACSLLRFVHQPTFYEMVDKIFDTPPENFGDSENRFLPLLYVVLALGCMFHTEPGEDPNGPVQNNYKAGIDQGAKYFRAARQMMDITDCRDLTSLQAIVFMILFLQASANLSTCYSHIGIALRSALRMGLHRNLAGNFNPIERETRRRVFWIIRKMDTYVSALLGFPIMLSYDDIDQELPIEVDDEYITKDAVLPMPPGKTSLLYAASNAHTRLMATLSKVIKYIYPTKGLEQCVQGASKSSYVISHAKIREIEKDLADWLDKLSHDLRPGGDGTPEVLRVQQLLRLSYAHVQMMLYRPFLHYVSSKQCVGKTIDERSYACAAACVSVSRNIIHITTEMKRRGLLVGAFWFTMYTTFFGIISLVYFVLENLDKPGSEEILADVIDGKAALNGLAMRSQAADRCSTALKSLFDQLPARLKEGRRATAVVQPQKKRAAPSPAKSRDTQSSPEVAQRTPGSAPVIGMLPRATTFPVPAPIQTGNLQRASMDGNHFQTNTLSNPNLRQSFHELMSPADLSSTGTPDSTTAANSLQQSPFPQQPFHINTAIPDLNAMMFPSADPFAYPNQPLMEFDNVKQENVGMRNGPQGQRMYLSNGANGPGLYDDLEGQLFGPLPPYLMQGQPNYDLQGQMDPSSSMMGGLNPQEMMYQPGVTANGEMTGNFDGIFSGDGDEWGSMLTSDQRYR